MIGISQLSIIRKVLIKIKCVVWKSPTHQVFRLWITDGPLETKSKWEPNGQYEYTLPLCIPY